jgi:CheY-like chemotaxis protein
MIELQGCKVSVAGHGAEALEKLEEEVFDLVFMDCHMPTMDGFAATQAIRARNALNRHGERMPVIALTANVIKGTRDECLAAGMDDYISKPFSLDHLESILSRWLKRETIPEPAQTLSASSTPHPAAAAHPVIDEAVLEGIRALNAPGMPDILTRMIGLFRQKAPELLEQIRGALSIGDHDGVYHAAHSLKSSSGNLGALAVADLSKDIELLGRENRLAEVSAPLEKLAREVDKALQALDEWVEEPA